MTRSDRFKPEVLQAAHKASSNHRAAIESSELVGCFYCRKAYEPALIEEWIDDDTTAMCAKCGIDSVIGSASGYPVADSNFLTAMHRMWF